MSKPFRQIPQFIVIAILIACSYIPCSGQNSVGKYHHELNILNAQTPIDLTLTPEVQHYIDLFLTSRRGDLELYLERSQIYFPLIESLLDQYELPLELKYLTIVESGLNPLAKSRSGAVGLWQFLYTTCSLFDLKVDSYIDERCDPYKATIAACRYMEYLYRTYNDWHLVMASYNGGPGEVRKAIERSGGKTNYWELRPYLSEQAKNYVPQFIAFNYLMNHYQDYGIVKNPPPTQHRETDTLMIDYAVSFEQISAIINIPVQLIKFLNPQYKRQYIPKLTEKCVLILPKDKIAAYLRNEKDILAYTKPQPDYNLLREQAGNTTNRTRMTHTVRKGEYGHKIALNYNCTIENIMAWNNMHSMMLYPGQTLDIWVNDKQD